MSISILNARAEAIKFEMAGAYRALKVVNSLFSDKVSKGTEMGVLGSDFSELCIEYQKELSRTNFIIRWIFNCVNDLQVTLHSIAFDAIKSNNRDLFKSLLDAGMDLNFQDKDGMTLLHVAVSNGRYEIVTDLLTRGARLDLENHMGFKALDIRNLK